MIFILPIREMFLSGELPVSHQKFRCTILHKFVMYIIPKILKGSVVQSSPESLLRGSVDFGFDPIRRNRS